MRTIPLLLFVAWMAIAPTAVETRQFDTLGRLTDIGYATGGSIHYTYDANGNLLTIVSTTATSGVGDKSGHVAFSLGPVVPNPGAGNRSIAFGIPKRDHVTLRVIDVTGREVATLFDRDLESGPYTARFSTTSWHAGEYFYRLEWGGQIRTGRLTVLR